MSEPAHYELGGSNAYRWLNCTASVDHIRDIPDTPAGAPAIEGTDYHAWCEFMLRNPGFVSVKGFVGKLRPGDPTSIVKLSKDMAKHVDAAANYVHSFINPLHSFDAQLFCEQKVKLSDISNRCGGTMDARVFNVDVVEPFLLKGAWRFSSDCGTCRVLHIFDFKYGFVYVDENANDQLFFYAYGGWLQHMDEKVDRVFVHIVQPRSYGEPIRCVEIPIFDLMDWAQAAKVSADAIESGKTEFKVGPWCDKTYCRGKLTCPAYSGAFDFVAKVVEQDKESGDTLSNAGGNEAVVRILEALPHIKAIQGYIKTVEQQAYRLAGEGRLPGYKLVAGGTRREWNTETGDVDAIASVLKENGIEPYAPLKLRGITEVEKELGRAVFAALAKDLTTKSDPKPTLAPVSDKRPAWVGDAGNDFNAVPMELL